ncbi:tRNA (adenine-N1)-methyltransferase [Thermofilum pendens]|uniref:tRNA (Adenine-57, 58-N(1)-) methyltransferase n=1 Tax=Thermofilum pendens (strain DSM 2475 / Hrk 5) TaxID=368408 RepID=A1RXE6_THEPD|nr:tRNA (adenine-N1)-methyltransferase [Thermofilum pendens]ABL77876.1 tRNA (adenine-57, 58-N(1)-) methyltransferase [Thermofilum pendens Hrk 5]
MSECVKTGDWVLLYHDEKHRYTVKVEEGRVYHTTHGSVNLTEVVGKRYGETVRTNIGEDLVVSRANLLDRLGSLRRFTQVIYPKDAAYIVVSANIGPGSRVVEAGTGTGFLTAILAWYVRPSGRVYTYEIRKDFYEAALENLKEVGLLPYVEAKNKDIRKGIDESDVDAVVLDMPDPWNVAEEAYNALTHGGILAVFVPTVTQLERVIVAVRKSGFKVIEPVEVNVRKYKPVPGELRPETLGVLHTGYLLTARKL